MSALLSDAVTYGAARIASALLSFALFALVGRQCSGEDAKRVYFFAFTFGFVVQTVRTLANLAASVDGRRRRAAKLGLVRTTLVRIMPIQAVAVLVTWAVLRHQHVPSTVLAFASGTLVLATLDTDLVRASLNLGPRFAVLFAAGGLLGIGVLLLPGEATVTRGCLAMLAQWAPAGLASLRVGLRLASRAGWASFRGLPWAGMAATAGVAAFDGLVLNTPFLIGDRFGTQAGLELSVSMRLFVSSLVLVPLVLHWSNSGNLGRLARRLGITEPRLYFAAVLVPGVAGASVLALAFGVLSGQSATLRQLGLAVLLLSSYAVFARGARYRRQDASVATIAITLAATYTAFLAFVLAGAWDSAASVPPLVFAQAAALGFAGLVAASARVSAVPSQGERLP